MALGIRTPSREGFWPIASRLAPYDGVATDRQDAAIRYWMRNVPDNTSVGHELAHTLLCVRSYLLGLIALSARKSTGVHPWEATGVLLDHLATAPDTLADIKRWSRRRYLTEAGPARVAATTHCGALLALLERSCRRRAPTLDEARKAIEQRICSAGLAELLSGRPVKIDYESYGEETTRTISAPEIGWGWPDWAVFMLDPLVHCSVTGYCHLRSEQRTFNLGRIIKAVAY